MLGNLNKLETIILTPENVKEHSENVAQIYKKGYFYNEETKKGSHPLNFLYHKETIEKAVKTNGFLKWMYLRDNGMPVFACIGLYDNQNVELMGVVNHPEYRGKGNYLNTISNNMNDFAVLLFNNGFKMIINEIQLTAKPILFNTLQSKTSPVGFTPNARKIGNSSGINRMSLYNISIYPSIYFRKNEIKKINCALSSRSPITYVIPEIKELSGIVCNNLGISAPKITSKKVLSEKVEVVPGEILKTDSFIFDQQQDYFVSNNRLSVYTTLNDNSCVISGLNKIKIASLNSSIESIIENNQSREAIMVNGVQRWQEQKVLLDNRFIPAVYNPSSANGKDSILMIRIKEFKSSDYDKIMEVHSKNMEFLSSLMLQYPSQDLRRNETFEIYKILPKVILNNLQ